MRIGGTAVLLAAIIASGTADAVEVSGVEVPERVTLADGSALALNGAGVRSKFFVRVYVGALYLVGSTHSAQAAIDADGPKRVAMHFLYDELARGKLVDAWNDGFEANHDEQALAALRERIGQFNTLFPDVRRGERIDIDLLPDGATQVHHQGRLLGTIPGADFQRAVLRIWLGERPADGSLKSAMLGEK